MKKITRFSPWENSTHMELYRQYLKVRLRNLELKKELKIHENTR